MAIRSGFFNSINKDRVYDAKRFAEYFASFIGNGVFPNPSSNLQVIANDDMTVTVRAGKAWINGYIFINDDDYVLEIDVPDGLLNRIDRVVVRYDEIDREIRLEIKKGDFASNPIPSKLQRDEDAYELGIADIKVKNGDISISQNNITDTRLSKELCGIVHGLVDQVDTETLFQQYLTWFNEKEDEFNNDLVNYKNLKQEEINEIQNEFFNNLIDWLRDIKGILNEDVAVNLQLNKMDKVIKDEEYNNVKYEIVVIKGKQFLRVVEI